jgi:hypothetical protein
MDKLRRLLLRKLHERYPGNIPVFIKDRFDKEWVYAWKSELENFLPLYHTIIKAAKKARQPVWNCGYGCGSFLFYLLDKGLNPLPPHWECTGCSRIETDALAELCFDLPVKVCPDCKTQMARDGINSSSEVALRSSHLELRVSEDFLEAANQAALSALKDRRVFQRRLNHKLGSADYLSYYLTDKGELPDSSLIHRDEFGHEYINVEDARNCSFDLLSVSIIGQTNYAMPKNARPIEEWIESKPDINSFLQQSIQDMKVQGNYYPENSYERIQQMIDLLQPETWASLIEVVCYAHGTYYLVERTTPLEMVKLIRGSDFRHIMYSRETLQFYLEKKGLPAILAWEMVHHLIAGRNSKEMKIYSKETPLLKKDKLFKSAIYLWPRTHAINWLWKYMDK